MLIAIGMAGFALIVLALVASSEVPLWLKRIIRQAVTDALPIKDDDLDTLDALRAKEAKLRTQVEELTIAKTRKEEEFARREREIEHKVGLIKLRQEQENELAKREATIAIRETSLDNNRKLFEEEMKFTRERMTTEVGYLKDMVGEMLERLPSAKIIAEVGGGDR